MSRFLKYSDLFLIGIFIGFYAFFSAQFTFWGDELFSVFYAKMDVVDFLKYYLAHPDPTHPAGYYFLLNVWQKIFHIGYANDTWFRAFSILCHFLAVGVIARKAFDQLHQRLWFIGLCSISSYFFTFSRMARYYSLAGLLYVATFYFFYRWLTQYKKWDFWAWVILSVVILNTDYPTYLLFFITAACFFLIKKGRISLKQTAQLGITTFLGLLPVAGLYMSLKQGSADQPWLFASANIPKILLKIGMGLGIIPYHVLVGEFFHPVLFGLLSVALGALLVVLIQKITRSNDVYIRDTALFIVINSVALGVLLSVLVTRYPIFSFSRFLLPCAYALMYLLVRVFESKKWVLGTILLINTGVLVANIQKHYFINPIFFYPNDQVIRLIQQYPQMPLLALTPKAGLQDPYSYLIRTHFPNRVHEPESIPTNTYLTVLDVRLEESDDSPIQRLQDQYPNYKIDAYGFDNIAPTNKAFMKKYAKVACNYKYYACVLSPAHSK